MKRKRLCLLLFAMMVLSLVLPTMTAFAADEQIVLRFMWWGGDARHEATLKAVERFMEQNPGIKVECEFQGFDGYEEKLATQLAGGTAPDLVQLTSFRMQEFGAKNDAFIDLSQYPDIMDISQFEATFLDNFCKLNGKLLGLPTGLNAHSIVFNKNVTDAAGVQLGQIYTWEEFITEGKKVHENNPEQYFFSTDRDGWYLFLRSYLRQATGNWLINDDYTLGVTREALIDAYTFLQRCYTENVCEPTETAYQYTGKFHENKFWLSGDMGALYQNSSSFAQYYNDNVAFTPCLIPIMDDAKASGIIVQPSQVFSVTKGKHVTEAIMLLNFLFNDEAAIMELKDCRGTPATVKGREVLEQNGLLDSNVSAAVNLNLTQNCEPVNQISEETLIKRVIMDISEELSFFMITPEQAADKTIEMFEETLVDMGLK